MRCVQYIGNGVVELNYMWLPTWIGQNTALKAELEKKLKEDVVGRGVTEELLDDLHDAVINYLTEKYPIEGLFDYLDGLKFVELDGKAQER